MTESSSQQRGVPMWAQIIIWVALLGALFIVTLRLKSTQTSDQTLQAGEEVANFSVPLYEGYYYNNQSSVSLKDLRGKVVVVNFWASWCKPCEQEAAEMEKAWLEYEPAGDVVFLGVDYVDTPSSAFIYLKKFGITYPNGEDLNVTLKKPISQYFNIQGVPETYFIDRAGILRYVQIGPFTSVDEIRAQIDKLLE